MEYNYYIGVEVLVCMCCAFYEMFIFYETTIFYERQLFLLYITWTPHQNLWVEYSGGGGPLWAECSGGGGPLWAECSGSGGRLQTEGSDGRNTGTCSKLP